MSGIYCDDCDQLAQAGGTNEAGPWVYCHEHYFARMVDGKLPAPVCDFCSSADVAGGFVYECGDFAQAALELGGGAGVTTGMQGDWCACPACARYIEADDWDGMARRSADRFVLHHGGTVADSLASMLPLHQMFRHEATGKRWALP